MLKNKYFCIAVFAACLWLVFGCKKNDVQDFLAHSQTENAVMLAVQSGNFGVLMELLQDGQKPDAFSSGRITPLMWACRCGNLKQAKLLIKYGADLDLESSEGITPFEYACISFASSFPSLSTPATRSYSME